MNPHVLPPPHSSSRFWADWSTRDFAQAQAAGTLAQTIAVLPVAATEQHGPHLPLKVDSALVDGVIAAALPHLSADVPALFLKTQTVGLSPEHTAFPGTLTLKAETTIRLWTDIAESVAASGVKKLVLLNSHGGQVGVMDIVARDLRARLGRSCLTGKATSWRHSSLHSIPSSFLLPGSRLGCYSCDPMNSRTLSVNSSQRARLLSSGPNARRIRK